MNEQLKWRFRAEWEPVGAVMLAWPHAYTDWAYMLDDVNRCYVDLCEAVARHAGVLIVSPDMSPLPLLMGSEVPPERINWFFAPTNDTWTRDYGPLVTTAGPDDWALNDYCFNGWGLKFAADKDNLVTRGLCDSNILIGTYVNRLGFVLEGGSVDTDGQGTVLATSRCLLSPNRNGDLTRGQVEDELRRTLGADRILWLEHGHLAGDDTDSHIDTLARFAPGDTIVYVSCDDENDEHYGELTAMRRELESFTTSTGRPYKLLGLPMPYPIYDGDGQRLPATYANFLVLNGAVLMPVYGQPDCDARAREVLRQAFPGYCIEEVDCRALIRQHGSLHCATMQLPAQVLSIVETKPYLI